MDTARKTIKGFTVSRRCDACGTRCIILSDEGEKCRLKCKRCGKVYAFKAKPA